jgi:hypothetical protein
MIIRMLKAVRQNIVAWLALFVAMGGTGIAAGHYIITSSRQIKPSVLRQLRGSSGVRGPEGKAGPEGKVGLQGATGAEGKAGTNGKDGTNGKNGTNGEPGAEGKAGSALAYAHVTEKGLLSPETELKNFGSAKVEHTEAAAYEGVYCISGLPETVIPHNVTVTAEAVGLVPFFATASIGKSAYVISKNLCTGATPQITVETFDYSTTEKNLSGQNAPFFIAIN